MSSAVYPALSEPLAQEVRRDSLRRAVASLAIQRLHLLGLLFCVAAFSGWLLTVSGTMPLFAVVYFSLLVVSAYYLGRLVLRGACLRNQLACSLPLILLSGCLTWALLMFAMHSLLPGSLCWHAIFLFGLAACGQMAFHRQRGPQREALSSAKLSLFVVVFALAASTCWGRGLLQSIRPAENHVQFRNSMDYFDHAAFTSQLLANQHLWQYGNNEIDKLPTPLYHYGSYLFPASLVAFSGLGTYEAVIAFWTPFGTFLSALAAYALLLTIGGRTAGLCALLALLLLPDASFYGFHNGVYGYHWRQQMSAGGLYGVACAALALLGLVEAQRCRFVATLLFGLGFGALTFLFKAQIFVVLMPLLIAWLVLCYPRFSVAWRLLLLSGMVAVVLAGLVVASKLHIGPTLGPDREFFEAYCKFVASEGKPGYLPTIVARGAAAVGRSRYYLAATTLVMLSTLGALAVLLPLLSLGAGWRKKLAAADLLPWLAVILYGLVLVGVNDSFLGVYPWELIHRPFVWTYYLVVIWCAGKAGVLLSDSRLSRWMVDHKLLGVTGLLLLVLPWHMGRNVQEGKISSRYDSCNLSFPRGLVECGHFVAHAGSRTDLIQDSQYDGRLVFGSLAERRSFLARPELWKRSRNPALPVEIERRFALLERLKTLTSRDAIEETVAATGIRWYLLHPEDRVPWPEEILAHPAFAANGFAVYDLSILTGKTTLALSQ